MIVVHLWMMYVITKNFLPSKISTQKTRRICMWFFDFLSKNNLLYRIVHKPDNKSKFHSSKNIKFEIEANAINYSNNDANIPIFWHTYRDLFVLFCSLVWK